MFPGDQGWDMIWDKAKHFFVSFFAVIALYGIPIQWFNVGWDKTMLLLGAGAVTLTAGIIWEFVGNWDEWDMLANLCGIVSAGILIGVAIW